MMAQDELAFLLCILLGTDYRLTFQYLTSEPTTKRRKLAGSHRAEAEWKLRQTTLDASLSRANIRASADGWTPTGDSCNCINHELWIIRETQNRAPLG